MAFVLPDEYKLPMMWERRSNRDDNPGVVWYRHWTTEDELVFSPCPGAYRVSLIETNFGRTHNIIDLGYVTDMHDYLKVLMAVNRFTLAKIDVLNTHDETRKKYDRSLSDG